MYYIVYHKYPDPSVRRESMYMEEQQAFEEFNRQTHEPNITYVALMEQSSHGWINDKTLLTWNPRIGKEDLRR